MEDMASALGAILNNPQTMQQIMGLASQLGLGGGAEAPPAAQQPMPSAFPQGFPGQQGVPDQQGFPGPQAAQQPMPFTFPPQAAAPQAQPAAMPSLFGNIDMNTIARISQIMGAINTRDQNVELLLALKPHFGEKRQKKVDDAIRVMQLVKVLPLLKEAGIFGSLFGGGED